MNAAQLADLIARHFAALGYPFPAAPEVRLAPPEVFPLVVLWDDDAQITRVIACCDRDAQLKQALGYAEAMAALMEVTGQAPCGTACHVAWQGGFINSDE